jgi:uncharacterized protein YcfL
MKKLILSLFLALLVLSGCKTKEIVNNSSIEIASNNISTTIIHDTVISYFQQKQEVKTNQKSKLSTDFSVSTAWIDSTGLLNHSIENFKVVPAKVIDRKVFSSNTIRLNITKTITITKTVKIPVEKTRWYGYFDIFLIATLILWVIYKLYRKFSI